MVLCIWWFVCLGIFLHVVLELYQHVCVYFESFERLDGYGICQSADNGKYIKYRFFAELMNLLFQEMRGE